jgi:hypothetical protein
MAAGLLCIGPAGLAAEPRVSGVRISPMPLASMSAALPGPGLRLSPEAYAPALVVPDRPRRPRPARRAARPRGAPAHRAGIGDLFLGAVRAGLLRCYHFVRGRIFA